MGVDRKQGAMVQVTTQVVTLSNSQHLRYMLYVFFLHLYEIVEGYIFIAVCLCMCVCVCLCVHVCRSVSVSVSEQNSCRTDTPNSTQFSLNGCSNCHIGSGPMEISDLGSKVKVPMTRKCT